MIEPVQIAFRTLRSPEQEELMRKEVLLQPLIDELLALRSIVLVVSERDEGRKRKTTRRYFISSLPAPPRSAWPRLCARTGEWRTV